MRVDRWRRIGRSPAALVLVTRRWRLIVELGRTAFLPLFGRQMFKTRVLSVWFDPLGKSRDSGTDDA